MLLTLDRYEASKILGLPEDGKCIVFSNSERSDASCALRWRYRYGYGLGATKGRALRYGTAWHAFLNDLGRAWAKGQIFPEEDERERFRLNFGERCPQCHLTDNTLTRCNRCDNTGLGVLPRVRADLRREALEQGEDATFSLSEVDEVMETLHRAAWGYLKRWGWDPPQGLKVVGVEVQMALPVLNPQGTVYTPTTFMERHPNGSLTLAGPHLDRRSSHLVAVQWPYYYIGTADLVLQSKRGYLWCEEHKSSTDPQGYVGGLSVDPQTGGYEWLLDGLARSGHFGPLARTLPNPVAGVIYDVSSSKAQRDPAQLKSRLKQRKDESPEDFAKRLAEEPIRFSKTTTFIPTWRWEATLSALGLDPQDYAEELLAAQDIDRTAYVRDYVVAHEDRRLRFQHEVYGIARQLAQMHRDHHRAVTPLDEAALFPRTPHCMRAGSGCSYRTICVHDSPEGRQALGRRPGPVWLPDDHLQTKITETP